MLEKIMANCKERTFAIPSFYIIMKQNKRQTRRGNTNMEPLSLWEQLLKRIVWQQLGEIADKKILDFGSGVGVTADHYAEKNQVTAIEPSEESIIKRWDMHPYEQIKGGLDALQNLENESCDIIFCHNVLEYADEREAITRELCRVLKLGGMLSVVKHNRLGRVMLETVLHNNFNNANAVLDGKDVITSKFGTIHYYEDTDIAQWCGNALNIVKIYGIRTFWDLQQDQAIEQNTDWQEKMIQIEMRVSEMEAFRSIAFFHHVILKK